MARSIGFEVINTDLIVGLPGETTDDAQLTAERVISMRPENITVHTLAVKRASRLNEDRQAYAQGLEAATRVVRERPELFWLTRGISVNDGDGSADVEVGE